MSSLFLDLRVTASCLGPWRCPAIKHTLTNCFRPEGGARRAPFVDPGTSPSDREKLAALLEQNSFFFTFSVLFRKNAAKIPLVTVRAPLGLIKLTQVTPQDPRILKLCRRMWALAPEPRVRDGTVALRSRRWGPEVLDSPPSPESSILWKDAFVVQPAHMYIASGMSRFM